MRRLRSIFAKTIRALGIFAWWLVGTWTVLAVYFSMPTAWWIAVLPALAVAALYLSTRKERFRYERGRGVLWRKAPWSIAALCFSLVFGIVYFTMIEPDPNQDWAPDHARMPIVTIDGDLAHVQNVRNFTWRTPVEYTPGFYDRTYDLSKISTMYYVVAPLERLDGVAHVMLCFAFTDGQAVTISVEGRRTRYRPYQIVPSIFRRFQIIYVIGDERDVVGLRGAVWKQPVRFYPANTTYERKRAIFVDMLCRAQSLEKHPEFYNLFTNNCMTNILLHMRRLGGRPVPHDLAVLLTGLSDRVAYRLGYFDTQLPFAKAREAFRIDQWMQTTPLDEGFSQRLRETLRRQEEEWMAKK